MKKEKKTKGRTIKKAFALLAAALMLAAAAGCSGSSGVEGLKKNRGYIYNTSSANEERVIEFLGKSYTVYFSGQTQYNWGTESAYEYRTAGGSIFRIDKDDRVLYYQDCETDYEIRDAEGGEIRTRDELRAAADVLLDRMYSGAMNGDYEATDANVDTSKVPYMVTYTPKAASAAGNTFKWKTYAVFVFDGDGNVLEFSSMNMGRFSGKQAPADLTDEKVREMILAELGDGADITLEGKKTLWILKDGRMACTVYFRDSAALVGTHLHLALIPLE